MIAASLHRQLGRYVDRWGPLAVAIVVLLVLIASLWIYGERISRIEGWRDESDKRFTDYRQHTESRLDDFRGRLEWAKQENEIYKAYVIQLRSELVQHGIEVPEPPKHIKIDDRSKDKEN